MAQIRPTLVGGTAANTDHPEVAIEPVELNLARVPNLLRGAISRHVYPADMEVWTFHLAGLDLQPAPPTRFEQALLTYKRLRLVNGCVFDHMFETNSFLEEWQPFPLVCLGSTYLPRPQYGAEAIRVAFHENGAWKDKFMHISSAIPQDAQVLVFV